MALKSIFILHLNLINISAGSLHSSDLLSLKNEPGTANKEVSMIMSSEVDLVTMVLKDYYSI